LGFIFYVNYKNILCTGKDIQNLGIDNFLIILSFLFCQIYLIHLYNRLKGNVRVVEKKPMKPTKHVNWRNDISSVDFLIGDRKYKKLSVKSHANPQKLIINARDVNIFDISRGAELYLSNGKVVTVVGIEKSMKNEKKVILKFDEELYYMEDFVYVNSERENKRELMNEFNVKSKANEEIGRKKKTLKNRIEEINKNISLIIDELNKKYRTIQVLNKKYEENENNNKNSYDDIAKLQKEIEALNRDKKQQEELLKSFKEQLAFLEQYRDELNDRMQDLSENLGEKS
jgi:hypothetical protein